MRLSCLARRGWNKLLFRFLSVSGVGPRVLLRDVVETSSFGPRRRYIRMRVPSAIQIFRAFEEITSSSKLLRAYLSQSSIESSQHKR